MTLPAQLLTATAILPLLLLPCCCPAVEISPTPPDPLFAVYATLSTVDMGLSLAGVEAGLEEGNPIVRLYIASPPTTMAVTFLRVVAIKALLDSLREQNPRLRTVLLVALVAVETYMVVNGLVVMTGR